MSDKKMRPDAADFLGKYVVYTYSDQDGRDQRALGYVRTVYTRSDTCLTILPRRVTPFGGEYGSVFEQVHYSMLEKATQHDINEMADDYYVICRRFQQEAEDDKRRHDEKVARDKEFARRYIEQAEAEQLPSPSEALKQQTAVMMELFKRSSIDNYQANTEVPAEMVVDKDFNPLDAPKKERTIYIDISGPPYKVRIILCHGKEDRFEAFYGTKNEAGEYIGYEEAKEVDANIGRKWLVRVREEKALHDAEWAKQEQKNKG